MRRIVFLVLSLVLICNISASAVETSLLDVRTEILKDAQEMKLYFATTRDPILLNSLWDSSIMVVSQLDAYFSMLGIFNTIKKENLENSSFSYLIGWLNQLKDTSDLNIKSLGAVKATTDARSKAFVLKLKDNFSILKERITQDLATVKQFEEAVLKK
jgi:hypothetical protein